MRLSQSFGFEIPLTYHAKALIITVLYGHRFFCIPFCGICSVGKIKHILISLHENPVDFVDKRLILNAGVGVLV